MLSLQRPLGSSESACFVALEPIWIEHRKVRSDSYQTSAGPITCMARNISLISADLVAIARSGSSCYLATLVVHVLMNAQNAVSRSKDGMRFHSLFRCWLPASPTTKLTLCNHHEQTHFFVGFDSTGSGCQGLDRRNSTEAKLEANRPNATSATLIQRQHS